MYKNRKTIFISSTKKQFEHDNNIKYFQAYLNTYNDIVENGYNISML